METISIYGLGKLGCTMLACFAYKGWHVIGVDVITHNVECLNRGVSPICEPQVNDLIKNCKSLIKATTDSVQATIESDVSFIIVPTPSDTDGAFITKYVEEVATNIAEGVKRKKSYHLVVVTSTVLPGDTKHIEKLIEDISGKKCGHDFGLCFNPDFIALGRIVHDFLNPDMVLIGCSDPTAGQRLQNIHERLTDNKPEFHLMNYHNAELAKITLNSFCTLKITFANIIAEICENMPDGDASAVLKAVGADSRIGNKYFKGGLSYGGPCFPRDNRAFANVAKRYGVHAIFAEMTDMINQYQKNDRIPHLINKILVEKKTQDLAVLGLTYKEDTSLVEESAALAVVEVLSKRNIRITTYDPLGMPETKKILGTALTYVDSIENCLSGQSVCLVASPWKEFRDLSEENFLKYMGSYPTVIDAWDLYAFNNKKIDCRKIGKAII